MCHLRPPGRCPAASARNDGVDLSGYTENAKALIGKVADVGDVQDTALDNASSIYEVAVDQLSSRNGNSHKAWLIPESSKGLVVYVADTNGSGITPTAAGSINVNGPFDGGGSDSFDAADVPNTADGESAPARTARPANST